MTSVNNPQIRLVLPWPPSVNHIYNRRRGGGVYLKPSVKAFREKVWYATRSQRAPMGIDYPVDVVCYLSPPNNRRVDADNLNKAILDALVKAGVLVDDSRGIVDSIKAAWGPNVSDGRVVVTIRRATSGGGGMHYERESEG